MKKMLTILLVCASTAAFAQWIPVPTEQLIISGKLRNELAFDIRDIDQFKILNIPDLVIRNQKGEIKGTLTGLQGFLLKQLLQGLEYPIDKPREMNEFYFTVIGADGYKAVFSWNEIFNTNTGDSLFVVTRAQGNHAAQMPQRILIVAANDYRTGPRFIENVERIVVARTK